MGWKKSPTRATRKDCPRHGLWSTPADLEGLRRFFELHYPANQIPGSFLADIFISYSRPDRPRIAKLAAALEAAGYAVWWDMNLTGGAQFSKETGEKLKEAKAVVVAWSKTSVESMWVADEATVGRTKRILVPIAIDAVEPPLGFGQIHAIDFSSWTGEAGEAPFLALNTSLAGLLERAPAAIAPAAGKRPWRRLADEAARHWKPAAAALALFAAALVGAFLFTRPAPHAADRGASAIEENAVAVLPFVNAGGEAANDYLSEGVADELRLQLARVAGLKVAARASSVAFRDDKLSAAMIARKLGVARLVEGSLRKVGDELKISVEVIDGRTGFQTWSNSYTRAPSDLLIVQQEIAAAVVAEIAGKGTGNVAPPPSTTDITAFDKLLLARHYEQEVRDAQVVDEAKLRRAIDLYRAAATADPNSALARSRLAGALLYAGDADAAEAEIFKALTLDPNDTEVQCTLGLFYFARNMPGVAAAFERAIALNPNNADAMSGYAKTMWPRQPREKTEQLFRRALDLDPMSLLRYAELGNFLGVTGQRDEALAVAAEITNRFSSATAFSTLAQIFEKTGDLDIAIAAAKKALSLAPGDRDLEAQLAELYAEIGDFETAARFEPTPGIGQLFWRRDFEALVDVAEEIVIDQPEEAQIWYMLGFGYNAAGDHDNAVRVLKIAGAPERAKSESNVGNDIVAMATLAAALDATGAKEEARETAEWTLSAAQRFLDFGGDQGWWAQSVKSCALAVLGRDDEAMAAFAAVNKGPGLSRLPWLKDAACYKRFADDARYKATIVAAERRQAEMRARVAAMEKAPQ